MALALLALTYVLTYNDYKKYIFPISVRYWQDKDFFNENLTILFIDHRLLLHQNCHKTDNKFLSSSLRRRVRVYVCVKDRLGLEVKKNICL